jgi:hypothetical protein
MRIIYIALDIFGARMESISIARTNSIYRSAEINYKSYRFLGLLILPDVSCLGRGIESF